MAETWQTRCHNHPQREAAARCPECGRFFCRECVTEHEGRVICSACLRAITEPAEPETAPSGSVVQAPAALLQLLLGLLGLWVLMYYAGVGLTRMVGFWLRNFAERGG
ncbi:MAG: rhomboid family protein [Phycisphaerae bacterium]